MNDITIHSTVLQYNIFYYYNTYSYLITQLLTTSSTTTTHYLFYYHYSLPLPPLPLQSYARQNEESVAQLLVEFFRYYAEQFDFRHSVVSIRQPRGLSKLDKAERDGWLNSDNLA